MSNMETSREALESIEPQITNITDRVTDTYSLKANKALQMMRDLDR